jgi:hypothetical protein
MSVPTASGAVGRWRGGLCHRERGADARSSAPHRRSDVSSWTTRVDEFVNKGRMEVTDEAGTVNGRE